ncbi:MAG: hypothetical protein Q7R41_05835 [Phycisphaerales bacterium]|nr:hypothetical protein [Phycisphaerales bacterium]
MSGWTVLIAIAICAFGVLVFLRIVARAIDAVESALRGLEERERRAQKLRRAAAAEQPPAQAPEKAA